MADIHSWIFSSRFFKPRKPQDPVSKESRTAYWKQGPLPEKIQKDNNKWRRRFAASPTVWKKWKFDTMPIWGFDYLLLSGVLPWPGKFKLSPLPKDIRERIRLLFISILPDRKCIKSQVDYIYENPMRFLLIVNYTHDDQELLRKGRSIHSLHVLPEKDRMADDMDKRYLLRERIPEDVIRQYLSLSSLQRYLALNKLILRSPSCKQPLILFRGSKTEIFGLTHNRPGYRFVTKSILSTSLSPDQAREFTGGDCCVYIFYLTRQVPRLFINRREFEILLPAGVEMEYAEPPWKYRDTKVYIIKALRVVNYDVISKAP